jgi:hypothetical protein
VPRPASEHRAIGLGIELTHPADHFITIHARRDQVAAQLRQESMEQPIQCLLLHAERPRDIVHRALFEESPADQEALAWREQDDRASENRERASGLLAPQAVLRVELDRAHRSRMLFADQPPAVAGVRQICQHPVQLHTGHGVTMIDAQRLPGLVGGPAVTLDQ